MRMVERFRSTITFHPDNYAAWVLVFACLFAVACDSSIDLDSADHEQIRAEGLELLTHYKEPIFDEIGNRSINGALAF